MKKFLCMMMAVLMVLAMAACGGEPANNGGNDTPTPPLSRSAASAPSPAPMPTTVCPKRTALNWPSRRSTRLAALPASRSNSAIRIPRASPKALSMPMAS